MSGKKTCTIIGTCCLLWTSVNFISIRTHIHASSCLSMPCMYQAIQSFTLSDDTFCVQFHSCHGNDCYHNYNSYLGWLLPQDVWYHAFYRLLSHVGHDFTAHTCKVNHILYYYTYCIRLVHHAITNLQAISPHIRRCCNFATATFSQYTCSRLSKSIQDTQI